MFHPLRKLRDLATAALRNATIDVAVGGVVASVNILRQPPESGWQNDDVLPGIYSFVQGEKINPSSMTTDERVIDLDVVIQAKGGADDVMDQLDAIQLRLEIILMQDSDLQSLCASFRPTGSRIRVNQGEVVFGSRIVTFAAVIIAPRTNPEIS